MDLPTCRACGQSVLDDDAVDCPFCGASMKTGKGGAAPKASKPAPVAKAASSKASPAPAATGGRAAPPMGLDDDDDFVPPAEKSDDPFELERSAGSGAIPLRARPVKGASLKVTCPMCETVGYASSKAAGKTVRCANPKCLVPTFEAPAPQEKPVEAPPPEPRKLPIAWIAMALLLIGSGGAAAWYVGLFDGGSKKKIEPIASVPSVSPGEDTGTKLDPDLDPNGKPPKEGGEPANAPPTLAKLREQAYSRLIDAARDQAGQRGKAVCRRMAAESALLAGDLEESRKQIDQLKKVAGELTFYAAPPLIDIAWHERAAQRPAEAKAALDEAIEAAKNLPPFGRETTEISIQLAAITAALGEMDQAEERVTALGDERAFGILTTPYLESWETRSYDMEAAIEAEPLLPWSAPHRVAVVKLLAAHGAWDAALAWTERRTAIEAKTECLVAWGEAAARAPDAERTALFERLTGATRGLPAETRARVAAAVALQHAKGGRTNLANDSLKAARAALGEMKAIPALVLPDPKSLLEAEPPEGTPMKMAALAAAEIARAEATLGQSVEATASLKKSLAFARGIGPSVTVANERMSQADGNASAVQNRLKNDLKLKTDDEARRAYNNYRRQLEKFVAAAQQRLDLQASLLGTLAETPLRDTVLTIVETGTDGAEGGSEPFLQTVAAWDLLSAFQKAGDAEKADALRKRLDAAGVTAGPIPAVRQQAEKLIAEKRYDAAGAAIEAAAVDKSWKLRWAFATAARLVKAGSFDNALQFIRGFRGDVIFREEALALTGSLAGKSGKQREVWDAAESKGPQPSERAALCRGFIAAVLMGVPEAKTADAR